jgi:RNA polymerase sigma-70 factor (ECF subfamily)
VVEGNTDNLIINSKTEFEKIFRDHYSSLCAYANHFLKDADASEEVVQEVMYRMWVNRSSAVITGSLQGYLFRAVRNGCLNVMKHMEVRDAYRQHREREAAASGLAEEDGLVVSELQQKIREAIDRLPLERRKIFIMSRYDGMTYGEIAGKLGISAKTVENQMGKALKFLREELSEYLPWLILFFFDLFRDQT